MTTLLLFYLSGAFAVTNVIRGAGPNRICGDHSDSDWTRYDEYHAYSQFAIRIDIDTTLCGFTPNDRPHYVANLMAGHLPGDSAIHRVVGTSAITEASWNRMRVSRSSVWVWEESTTLIFCYRWCSGIQP
jgi:hypothetical protein